MQNNNNYFKLHKILLIVFSLFFVVFLISAVIADRGLFFDSSAQFFAFIGEKLNGNGNFAVMFDYRTRFFSNFISVIPLNIALLFGLNDIHSILDMFTASFYLMPFVALILNYLVALRTKRFDIALWAFVMYTFYLLPNAVWLIREIHLAYVLQFIPLSYFLSHEKFNKIDCVIIAVSLLYLFESFETACFIGLLFFVSSVFYFKRNDPYDNSKIKSVIGICGLLTVIYTIFRTIVLTSSVYNAFTLSESLMQWLVAFYQTFLSLFSRCLIITASGVIMAIIGYVIRRRFKISDLFCFVFFTICILYIQTEFVPEPDFELLFFALSSATVIPIFLTLILFDYLKIDIDKINPYFNSNLLQISLIVGILYFLWQINGSYYYYQYVRYFKDFLVKSEKPIDIFPKEDFDKYRFMNYYNCFGTMQTSVLLSPDRQVKTIIFPNPDLPGYQYACFDDKKHTFASPKYGIINLQSTPLPDNNNYYDFELIIKEFEKTDRIR